METAWVILIKWMMNNSILISIFLLFFLSISKIWKIVMLKKNGCLIISPLREDDFLGLTLGILGMFLTTIGVLLPIYIVKARTFFPVDQGEAELLVLDGWNGVQMNISLLRKLPSISSLQSCMRVVFLASIWFTILDIMEMKRAKHIGNKQMRGGAFLLASLMVLLLSISRLSLIMELLSADLRGILPPLATEAMERIALQPLQGVQMFAISGCNTEISWGVGPGFYVILAAAIIKIAGGIILRRSENPSLLNKSTEPLGNL